MPRVTIPVSIKVKALSGQKFINFERDIPTRKALDKIFKAHRITVEQVMAFDNIETVKRAVEIDSGVAIVPQETITQEIAKETLAAAELENVPFNPAVLGGSLVLGPGERSDLLFDFSAHAGQSVILYTDAPSPFPGGDPRNDYFPGLNVKGNPVNGLTTPGNGPNTRVIMRFNVAAGITGSPDLPLNSTKATDLTAGNDPLPVPLGVTALPPGVTVKQLTLNEAFDEHGRLAQLLGTDVAQPGGGFGQPYLNTTTETAADGDTQVWQIANLSADVHPIHFHLVNVQIISRQPFAVASYKGIPGLKAPRSRRRRRNEAGRRPSG